MKIAAMKLPNLTQNFMHQRLRVKPLTGAHWIHMPVQLLVKQTQPNLILKSDSAPDSAVCLVRSAAPPNSGLRVSGHESELPRA